MNAVPAGFSFERDLPAGFDAFYRPLHERFAPRQRELAAARKRALSAAHRGRLPDYGARSAATTEAWAIDLRA